MSRVPQPADRSLLCLPAPAAPCWRAQLPRWSSRAPLRRRPVPRPRNVQPREPRSRHRRATFQGACFGSRPSAHVLRRSRSGRSGSRTDGEGPLQRAGSTAQVSSTGRMATSASNSRTARMRSTTWAAALDARDCGPATCSFSTGSATSGCTSGTGAWCTRRPPVGWSRSSSSAALATGADWSAPGASSLASRYVPRMGQMGRTGIEPVTLGLKVPCSTN